MAAVDVADVGAVIQIHAVFGVTDKFGETFTGGDIDRQGVETAVDVEGIIMAPVVKFELEDDAVAFPNEITDIGKTQGSVFGIVPEYFGVAGFQVGDHVVLGFTVFEAGLLKAGRQGRASSATGGGLAATLTTLTGALTGGGGCGRDLAERHTGLAEEGDFFAVGRERRIAVAIDAGVDVGYFAGIVFVKPDEAVIAAVGDEGDFFAVGGPAIVRVGTVGAEEGF